MARGLLAKLVIQALRAAFQRCVGEAWAFGLGFIVKTLEAWLCSLYGGRFHLACIPAQLV